MTGSVDPRTPCLVGVSQLTHRPDQGPAPEPLDMWEQVCRSAADDSGGRGVLDALDSLHVVYCQSWQYDDPPARLAGRLGIDPGHAHYSGIGGTVPQQLVQDAALSILAGDSDAALICGGEALATKRRLKKAGEKPQWSHREPERSPFPFEAPFHPAEIAHEVFQAWLTFPVFDIGRRAHLGIAPDEYRARLGELMAPMTEIAASNPHAWFPVERSADELITPTPENRMVGYPYTKYMVAVMDVDMAGALVLTSHARADELGVPADRRVYLRSWAYVTDPTYLAEHEDFHGSPAMAAAAEESLRLAGVGVDEVGHLDLYSCFGSSINYALDALGMAPDDPRGVTETGGLPFSGGPGSNYMLHSIATMVDVLRADPGSHGMVSGVGMHMTKHAYGVYSTTPATVTPPDLDALQARVDQQHPAHQIRDTYTGTATVATYTVAHGRDGSPDWGLAICDLPQGDRCYARITDVDLLDRVEREEWVGTTIEVTEGEGGVNLVTG